MTMRIYRSHLPDRAIPYTNVYSFVVSNPNKTPDSFNILIEAQTGKKITFGEWKRDTRRWATGLQSIGFKRGDVLALFSPNELDYSITMFGPLLLGAITTTANASYTEVELAHQLKDAGATVMVTHPELLSVAIAAAQQVGLPKERIFLFGDQVVQGFRPYTSLLPSVSTPEHQLAQVVPLNEVEAKDTTALICYSSGTTGKSKGVELTHLNICVNVVQLSSLEGPIPARENTTLSVLPMYHLYGLQLHLVYGVYSGFPLVSLRKFQGEAFLQAIQVHKIKSVNLVPPQVLFLVKSPQVENFDLSSLRQVTVAAAPCSRELTEALLNGFPKLAFRQGYGMSELSPVVAMGIYGQLVYGSSGRMVPNQEVRLVDPATGQDAVPGERGEIWVRGPHVMKGYRNNPKATQETIDVEGWLHTGDVGFIDEGENLFVVDRIKELIKYKGFQVAPAELEAILLSHPHILDTAVIGVEDKEQATELPLAFVVKHPEHPELSEQGVKDFVDSKVAPHKKLRGGVRFIDAIPKSAAGKILKKDLRVLLAHSATEIPRSKL
ncbi:putative fatty-acid--CoA ligase FadD10 [Modicella reniformis]|uniref:Fatty-acid--CoA ligase FadD10 n=1 Tax=Modicella reniformis TaxID=1440133 RepID=A0A9P6MHQ9_9FUNG|nr:putative fatty-acid--CoA ligase FadD10 [Modicella reniformis]